MDTRLQKIESGRQNRKQRNRQNGNSSSASSDGGGGDNDDDGGKAKCKHCSRVHPKTAEEDCWTLPENASSVPAWFIRKQEKKSKGK